MKLIGFIDKNQKFIIKNQFLFQHYLVLIILLLLITLVYNYKPILFFALLLINIKTNITIIKENILIFRVLINGYCFTINKELNIIQYFNNKCKKDSINFDEVIEFDIIDIFNFYENKIYVNYKKRNIFYIHAGIRLYLKDGNYRDMFAKVMRNDYDKTIESLEQIIPNREKRLKQEMAK